MSVRMIPFSSDKKAGICDALFSVQEAEKAVAFHRSLHGYEATPLRHLKNLSKVLNISGLYVKDESRRFGLNAFKGLGGSYALAKVMAEKTGMGLEDVSKVPAGTFTFVTATDGNHGRGVAWAAKNLSQKAVVYMPKGSARERLENIRRQGAEAEITDLNYDNTVRFASEQAQKNGWILVQDTAWEGYEKIPTWIMQGYMTMAWEAVQQMGDNIPTHIFLQAGVGAMAGAVTGFFSNYYGEKAPKIIIVEPDKVNCLFKTANANDGTLHKVDGDLDSIMAGLCCGEVCTVGWEILKHRVDYFFSCPDYVAADGMRVLGNPLAGDERIISGESGAVTSGLVYNLMNDPKLESFRKELGLGQDSVVLCLSTEGDTDKENYRHIVWDGWYRNENTERNV